MQDISAISKLGLYLWAYEFYKKIKGVSARIILFICFWAFNFYEMKEVSTIIILLYTLPGIGIV